MCNIIREGIYAYVVFKTTNKFKNSPIYFHLINQFDVVTDGQLDQGYLKATLPEVFLK